MEKRAREVILANLKALVLPDHPVYLVGGAVRDWLLDRQAHDLDFVMAGETRPLAQKIAREMHGALYTLDEERDTTRVVLDLGKIHLGAPDERMYLDFSVLRAADIDGDLRARDFTINAMALDVSLPDHLIDPLGGVGDLRKKRIRVCSSDSLSNDPVRALRAIRQALGFGFMIEPETLKFIRAAAPFLPRVSNERIRDELFKMLNGPQVALAVRLLDQVGALGYVLPELEKMKGISQPPPHTSDVWEHTLRVVQYLEQLLPALVGQYDETMVPDLTVGSAVLWLGRFRDPLSSHFSQTLVSDRSIRALLFLSALYHDISKPQTRQVDKDGKVHFLRHQELGTEVIAERGRLLALSVHEIERMKTVVREHMRVHFITNSMTKENENFHPRRTTYRYFHDTGAAGIDICLLSLADLRGTYGVTLPQELWQAELETCRMLMEAYWEKAAEVVSPPRFLSGNDLMSEFGLAPGKDIGRLLGAIREAQAVGEVVSRDAALVFARNWLEKSLHPGSRSGRIDPTDQEHEG